MNFFLRPQILSKIFKVEEITIVTINSAKLIVKSFGFERQRENERKRERGKRDDRPQLEAKEQTEICVFVCERESLTEQRNTQLKSVAFYVCIV